MSDLVGNPEDRFSGVAAHFSVFHALHSTYPLNSRLITDIWNPVEESTQQTVQHGVTNTGI